jgi:hypothetical protein
MFVGVMELDPSVTDVNGSTVDTMAEAAPVAGNSSNNTVGAIAEAALASARVDNNGPLLYPAIELYEKNDMSGTARFLADTALADITFRSWPSADGTLRIHPANEAGVIAFKGFRARQDEVREEIRLLKEERALESEPPVIEDPVRPFTEAQARAWDLRERWDKREERINRHLFTLVDSDTSALPAEASDPDRVTRGHVPASRPRVEDWAGPRK